MMMWCDGAIIIVELQNIIHDWAVHRIDIALSNATGTGDDHLCSFGGSLIRHLGALGNAARLGNLRPDSTYGPSGKLHEAVKPPGLDWIEFHTLKVEVGVHQQWGQEDDGRSLNYKADAWRQYPGVQYVLSVHLSEDLNVREYRLDSIVNGGFEAPRMSTTPIDRESIIGFDARRLLGLPPGADLPVGFHDPVMFNLFDVVEPIREEAELDYDRERLEKEAEHEEQDREQEEDHGDGDGEGSEDSRPPRRQRHRDDNGQLQR